MNILALGAHPDDIEFGCAGTLAKYANNGHNIYLMVMTRGEKGGDGNERATEQKKAREILMAKRSSGGGSRTPSRPPRRT